MVNLLSIFTLIIEQVRQVPDFLFMRLQNQKKMSSTVQNLLKQNANSRAGGISSPYVGTSMQGSFLCAVVDGPPSPGFSHQGPAQSIHDSNFLCGFLGFKYPHISILSIVVGLNNIFSPPCKVNRVRSRRCGQINYRPKRNWY